MNNPRKRYLRAMVEAVFGPGPVPVEALEQWRPGLLAALDAVQPLIEADERGRIAQEWQTKDWPLLTKHVKAGSVIGAAQAVTDWLRDGSRDE